MFVRRDGRCCSSAHPAPPLLPLAALLLLQPLLHSNPLPHLVALCVDTDKCVAAAISSVLCINFSSKEHYLLRINALN